MKFKQTIRNVLTKCERELEKAFCYDFTIYWVELISKYTEEPGCIEKY